MLNMVVGTAGHIDHGKSSLVRALTGIDPDRLKEEKARGITIDLGLEDVLEKVRSDERSRGPQRSPARPKKEQRKGTPEERRKRKQRPGKNERRSKK